MDLMDRRRRAVLIAAIAGGLVLLVLIGIGIYGLLRGPDAPSPAPSETALATAPTSGISPGAGPRPVVGLGGAEAFAREVAAALFTWDTTSGYGPADYAQALADVTSSVEADAAAGDVRAYLPTPPAWAQLRTHQTRQWLTIDTIGIPVAWETAVTQAAPGQLPGGAVAYTIRGTRHRGGTWNTEPVATEHRVAFTVFLTCATVHTDPHRLGDGAAETCQLLRLSQLDNPLR
ncbi:hypothetical protein [uncultured Microbacterium sp.]|uniref:hypothetical protein n=1 Tax=uncultured Microbacterium sp. TaxID=191216 RepID=UPI0026134886|nr:hypothetical protein [uncultured Microbacterium sp.]